jgi:hypothetical protein
MLDQMPETTNGRSRSSAGGDIEDAVFVEGPNAGAGDGGAVGRFRAGLTTKPGGRPPKPMWRRLLVFFL